MQWDGSTFAGFTQGTPWLRLAADSSTVNVATLSKQSDSVLSLYRALIGLRNANSALNVGRVEGVASDGKVLRYQRVDRDQRFSIMLNFTEDTEEAAVDAGYIVASTHMDRLVNPVQESISLRAFEGVLIKVAG
jgi:alpha-glucosidase